jgi:hypothetical protein
MNEWLSPSGARCSEVTRPSCVGRPEERFVAGSLEADGILNPISRRLAGVSAIAAIALLLYVLFGPTL